MRKCRALCRNFGRLNKLSSSKYFAENVLRYVAIQHLVCYTAVFSVVTQGFSPQTLWGGTLRDDTKNGCVADYSTPGSNQNQRGRPRFKKDTNNSSPRSRDLVTKFVDHNQTEPPFV